jgi:N,N'-diacetylchitobiose phosphorylase
MRFNNIPLDQPGRYLYVRDDENGDFWSASWQPVGKPLENYQSECRHGTAYTVIESRYDGIATRTTYFVPLGGHFEYWWMKLSNHTERARKLSVFTYCEFASNWDTHQDMVNLQYSLFIVRGEKRQTPAGDLLRIAINDHLAPDPGNFVNNDQSRHAWMALKGADICGYDTDRSAFLGPYRSYDRPLAVVQGSCSQSNAYGDNACGVLQAKITLEAGETRDLLVLLGIGPAESVGQDTVAEYGSPQRAAIELARLKTSWHRKLENLVVETPDENFNHMLNVWSPYNALVTFNWSRAASLVYNGERNGLGFRDSVQDVLGILTADLDAARARLELMLTGQLACGGAMPVVKPFDHHPGQESGPGEEHFRSDDSLWFFNAIPAYVAESGDLAFYHKILPYADQGGASVLGHLRRALAFNLERCGKHGLPYGLEADWNDCLKLGYHGESLFVAFQVVYGLRQYAAIVERLGLADEVAWAEEQRAQMEGHIQRTCWDGEWWLWAIGEDGTRYGTKEYPEGQVYLNTQVWSVLSGVASQEQSRRCMQAVNEHLATPYGLMLSAPPFVNTAVSVMRAVLFNPGIKENAGIFNHTQGWGVMAECLLGNGDRAFEYYRAFMPASYNDSAEIRQAEPYVQAQTTYSTFSPRAGNARTSWLSGAVPWAYFSAVNAVLGIQAEIEGLRLDPCIPHTWPGFRAVRRFRGRRVAIEVINPSGVCRGITSLHLNGELLPGSLIPVEKLKDDNQVTAVLG